MTVPRLSITSASREHWLAGFVGWAGTWRVIPLILFVLTYKLGEFAIGPMVKPFWVDYGKTIWPVPEDLMFQIGLFPTTFGIVLSVVGALMGGAFISRYGIFHGVWFLGLLQAVSNLGYSLVDWLNLGRFGLYGASMFESLSGGLGTAAFLAFLDERLPEGTRHGAVRVPVVDFFAHRPIDRRDSAVSARRRTAMATISRLLSCCRCRRTCCCRG